jgi:hypothetical protein
LSKSDIYSIKDGLELCKIVEDAIPAWEAYKQSRADKDADAGSNKIYEDEDWEVFIPENKGAACKLGKNTKWCTAAPGLEYYKHYHKQDDPLIIFISKEDPSEKYQFHYGTEQFMDKNDRSITTNESLKKIYYELHSIVTNLNKLPENIRQEAKTLSKNYQPLSNGGYKLYDEEKNRVTYYDQNGEIHREDGPAVIERTETNNVYRDYYNHGEYIRMDLSRAKEDEPYEAYLIKEMIAQELRKLIQERKLGKPSSETNLGDWFKRKGAPGKTGGWVDCNTCRDGKCKPCGRQEGEKRGKYPRCRPTPSQCKGYKRRGDNLQKE